MDPVVSMRLARQRASAGDLAHSALPDAPQVPDARPGAVRRRIAAGLLAVARRLDPGSIGRARAHRTPMPSC